MIPWGGGGSVAPGATAAQHIQAPEGPETYPLVPGKACGQYAKKTGASLCLFGAVIL
jgi:hypothetical protein